MCDSRPVCVFDSGVGGLTVLEAIRRLLPEESTVYLADLAHFPYGPKPQSEVRRYSLAIIEHLVSLQAKLVVIACNTASSAALVRARERFSVPIVGVVEAGARAAAEASSNGRVAIISTEGTLRSGAYQRALAGANGGIEVFHQACPDLVEIVESGGANQPRAALALMGYLSPAIDFGADVLILGCTHYPLLSPTIRRLAGDRINIVDSAQHTAGEVKQTLMRLDMAAPAGSVSSHRILATGNADAFQRVAESMFEAMAPLTGIAGVEQVTIPDV